MRNSFQYGIQSHKAPAFAWGSFKSAGNSEHLNWPTRSRPRPHSSWHCAPGADAKATARPKVPKVPKAPKAPKAPRAAQEARPTTHFVWVLLAIGAESFDAGNEKWNDPKKNHPTTISNWWFLLRGPIAGGIPTFPAEHQQQNAQNSHTPLQGDTLPIQPLGKDQLRPSGFGGFGVWWL